MRERLSTYLKNLFLSAPDTPRNRELQEEILQNNLEKFDDLVREGTPEAAAFNIVVGELGDVTELMEQIRTGGAAAGENAPAAPFYAPSDRSLSPEEQERVEKRNAIRALMLAAGVMLCILSVVPCILFGEYGPEEAGPVLMFFMIAVAVGLFVYRHHAYPPLTQAHAARAQAHAERRDNTVFGSLSALLWAVILVIYFGISFSTGAWYITWLVFPIGAALEGVLKAIFDLTGGNRHE